MKTGGLAPYPHSLQAFLQMLLQKGYLKKLEAVQTFWEKPNNR